MEKDPSVAWFDITWNPVRGCTKTSPGCERCFAARYAERWRGVVGHAYERGFDVRTVPEKLALPFGWSRSKKVLVASMSDLFHEEIPDEHVARVFEVMLRADWHHYFVLTKRAERMRKLMTQRFGKRGPPGHVWLGVSAEDAKHCTQRGAKLARIAGANRFLCLEPLLGDPGTLDLDGIGWVQAAGESGLGARPAKREWVQSVRKQCRAANVPFFFKQWGGAVHGESGRVLDGKTHDRLPRLAELELPSRKERRRRAEEAGVCAAPAGDPD
jgi:protein gp37